MKFHLINLFVILFFNVTFSQIKDVDQFEIRRYENLFEFSGSLLEETTIFEMIEGKQIDLNQAQFIDLIKIPSIDYDLAVEILNYRKKIGIFFSARELMNIEGVDERIYEKISPFVFVSENISDKINYSNKKSNSIFDNDKIKICMESGLINYLQLKKGIIENKYLGSGLRYYNRAKIIYDEKVKLQFLSDKDFGERSLFDFTSYSLTIKDLYFVKKIVIGDYKLSFGQGLVLSQGFGFSKSTNVIYTAKKNYDGLKENGSLYERGSFRGVAFDIKLEKFIITPFYSFNKIDGNIDTSDNKITSISMSGYHRTVNEESHRNIVDFKMFGGRIGYNIGEILKLEFVNCNTIFSRSFKPKYKFDLEGDRFSISSLNFDLALDNFNSFGEIAFERNNVAFILGLNKNYSKFLDWLILIRNYPEDFSSLYGKGFSELEGSVRNEFGIYNGIRIKTPIGIINTYCDIFSNYFPSSTIQFPENGTDFLIEFSSKEISDSRFSVLYKNESKENDKNLIDTTQLERSFTLVNQIQRARFDLTKQFSKNIDIRFRVEYCLVQYSKIYGIEKGLLTFFEINSVLNENLNALFRISYFNTDSYNSRIYQVESGAPTLISNVGLFGQGLRWYSVVGYRIKNYLNLYLKYAETYKSNEKTIGSGYDEINSNLDNRLSLIIEMNF